MRKLKVEFLNFMKVEEYKFNSTLEKSFNYLDSLNDKNIMPIGGEKVFSS